jgi:predicted nucleic acid-binding protein
MTFLLDTNVVSEIRKREPDAGVTQWLAAVDGDELFLSVLVVGELQQGIERLAARDPSQARALTSWLDGLRSGFADRIVPVTLDVALTWGRLNAQRPLPVVDGLLAATAITHGWTLVTRDDRAVAGTGVALVNPFA